MVDLGTVRVRGSNPLCAPSPPLQSSALHICGDPRSARAEALIADGGVIGVQVLNEFTNVTRRKLRWDWEQIEASLAVIEELLGVARPLTTALHARSVVLARDSKLSFYDALIVAAAMDADCETLCSEELQDGRKFGAVTVENPFRR